MEKKMSIAITSASMGLAVNLVQAVIVWVVSSSFLAGLGAFGAGILPAAAAGWSPYLGAKLLKKAASVQDEDEDED
jgi:hypothetical protein